MHPGTVGRLPYLIQYFFGGTNLLESVEGRKEGRNALVELCDVNLIPFIE